MRPGLILDQLAPARRRGPLVRWSGALVALVAILGVSLAITSAAPPGAPGVTPGAMVAVGSFAAVCTMLIWVIDRLTIERQAHAAREAQRRAIMDTAPVGIALYELPSGRLLEGGSHLERMLQRSIGDWPDIHDYGDWVCYHADGSQVSPYEYPLARMMLENAEAPELEAHYQRRDGVRIWIRIMGRLIRDARGKVIGGVIALVDIDAERRAQQEAQRLADEFRALADNIPTLCWMARPDGHIYWHNQRWHEYFGTSPESDEDWASVHDPAVLPQVLARWRHSLETGTPFEMTFPMRDAHGVFHPFLTRVRPIRDESGQVIRWFGVNIDITDQEQHEQRQLLLINELNHRVKNTLATVQSIAAQTLRSRKDPREVFENFEARLLSLSEAHNLLTQRSWEGASVGDIVERAARPFQIPDRKLIEAQGPRVWLRAESALGLSMALHELATNAVKHGALSAPEGRVAVRWSCNPKTGAFQLSWTESGGPSVAPPTRRGFGLRLIERALAGERGAKAELSFRPEGLRCSLTAALPAASELQHA